MTTWAFVAQGYAETSLKVGEITGWTQNNPCSSQTVSAGNPRTHPFTHPILIKLLSHWSYRAGRLWPRDFVGHSKRSPSFRTWRPGSNCLFYPKVAGRPYVNCLIVAEPVFVFSVFFFNMQNRNDSRCILSSWELTETLPRIPGRASDPECGSAQALRWARRHRGHLAPDVPLIRRALSHRSVSGWSEGAALHMEGVDFGGNMDNFGMGIQVKLETRVSLYHKSILCNCAC